jgi:acyl transferase domain-containing protein
MAGSTPVPGTMASVLGGAEAFRALVRDRPVALACENSPTQRVVSGEVGAVEECVEAARGRGMRATRLRVTGAFHSPLMEGAVRAFGRALAAARMRELSRPALSTITGGWLAPDVELPALLTAQLTSPVRFLDAARAATGHADLMIEAGPGRALTALAPQCSDLPCLAIEAGAPSRAGALRLGALRWLCEAPAAGTAGEGWG